MPTADTNTEGTDVLGRVRSVLHSQRVRKWSSLVAIQPHGSRVPVFGVHNAIGEVSFYHRLAPLLGPDQPVYGLRARGLGGKSEPLSRIEDMAAAYLREIAMVQPHGPYIIIGRCSGSRVAYEMAQQLTRSGEALALLCVIDPGSIPAPMSFAQWLENLARYLKHHAAGGSLRGAVVRSAIERLRRVRGRFPVGWNAARRNPLREKKSRRAKAREARDNLSETLSSSRFRESAYPGRILFFAATDSLRHEHAERTDSWRRVASLDVLHVPGGHRTIASPANLSVLAQHLRRHLDDASTLARDGRDDGGR